MPNCFLVHGWDSEGDQGGNSVDKLGPLVKIRGWTPANFDWSTSWRACTPHSREMDRIGQRLAKLASQGDAAIGHSTGAAIVYKALCYKAPFRYVVLLNANLDSNVKFPVGHLERVMILSSPQDRKLDWSQLIPFNIMGAMGRRGYTGDDERVSNNVVRSTAMSNLHAEMFDADKFDAFGPLMASLLPKA